MRYLLALAPLALLAACGGNKAANNAAAKAPANTATSNATTPAPVTMAPAGPAAVPSGPPVMAARAEMVAECVSEAGSAMPAGIDAEALCGCAVDQVMAGASQNDATRACAAQMGVTMPAG